MGTSTGHLDLHMRSDACAPALERWSAYSTLGTLMVAESTGHALPPCALNTESRLATLKAQLQPEDWTGAHQPGKPSWSPSLSGRPRSQTAPRAPFLLRQKPNRTTNMSMFASTNRHDTECRLRAIRAGFHNHDVDGGLHTLV
jgi:hypothetical protein